jgi:hypothetical protein
MRQQPGALWPGMGRQATADCRGQNQRLLPVEFGHVDVETAVKHAQLDRLVARVAYPLHEGTSPAGEVIGTQVCITRSPIKL